MTASERTDWPLVLMLWLAGLLAAAQFGKLSLALGPLAELYGRTPASMAIAVSLVGLVGIVFGAMAGAMVGRVGFRRALIAALLLGAAMSIVQALTPALPVFLASRAVEGISHLTLVVAAPTVIAARSTARDQPVTMGLWGTFFGVSFAATALVLPWLIPLAGMRGVLAFHGIGMAAIALVLWLRMTPGPPVPREPLEWIAEHRRIYTTPRLLAPASGFFWHTLIFVALLTFLPGLLDGPAWFAAALPILSLVGTFSAGLLARHVAPDRIAAVSFVLTALIVPGLAFAPMLALPLFVVIGLLPGASFAAIPHFNAERVSMARANGAIAQLGNVGTTAGTPIYALAVVGSGLTGMLGLTVLFSLLGLASVVAARRWIDKWG